MGREAGAGNAVAGPVGLARSAGFPEAEWSDDGILDGRLRLLQPRRGHRFGHDAILLAAATPALAGERAVELGAGVGAAALALAWRVPGLHLTMIEIDPALVGAATENAARNGLADRVAAVRLDVAAPLAAFVEAELPPGVAARVLMNPPFNDPGTLSASPDPARRRAHVAVSQGETPLLDVWIGAAARLLRPGGTLSLIWPAAGLGAVLARLSDGFGGIGLVPVHGKDGQPAIRVLVRATKGGRAPLALLPGLVLADAAGRPTAAAEAVLRHGTALPLAAP
ncbi:tRNA1(Val) (adenine(37)-N6)-methyltransferase [Rhodoplanes sp. SY1]|uniref:tRNA1(Val) (adenine(37)-N6)-methyltransferase n=1 Tax=Rhodoplanes sp. SY1 TaxID=3166646 RepID=UPI0038B4B43B